jgi:hypothetical protein
VVPRPEVTLMRTLMLALMLTPMRALEPVKSS